MEAYEVKKEEMRVSATFSLRKEGILVGWGQGLSQDFKRACPEQQISAHPDLATELVQILIPTTFNNLLCQKEQFTHQPWAGPG